MTRLSYRTCVICRTKKPKRELFRFLNKNGRVVFDKKQEMPGRGFYICSKDCWNEGVKKKKKIKIGSRENKYITLPEIDFEL